MPVLFHLLLAFALLARFPALDYPPFASAQFCSLSYRHSLASSPLSAHSLISSAFSCSLSARFLLAFCSLSARFLLAFCSPSARFLPALFLFLNRVRPFGSLSAHFCSFPALFLLASCPLFARSLTYSALSCPLPARFELAFLPCSA
jgi:hypothetical protein